MGGRRGTMVQGSSSIAGRDKIDRGRLRIVWEMEKPKNLYVQLVDMNWGQGRCWWEAVCSAKGNKGEKKGQM